MYVISNHQRYGQTDGRTSSDPMTATLLKHVAVNRYSPLRGELMVLPQGGGVHLFQGGVLPPPYGVAG